MDKTTRNGKCKPSTQKHLFITTTDKHGVPPTKRLFKVAMLDPSPNLLVHGERLEIRDNLGCCAEGQRASISSLSPTKKATRFSPISLERCRSAGEILGALFLSRLDDIKFLEQQNLSELKIDVLEFLEAVRYGTVMLL
ncbi:hypothetical protein Tco_1468435 [Tanacetum coccineum]